MRPQRPLAEHVELRRGITYKSALLGRPGPVLLGLASIARDGGFRDDSLRTYGGESPADLLLHPGDIYVSLKDVTQSGDLLGAVSRVPTYVGLGRLTQDTVKLILRPGAAPSTFLYWVLRSPEYRRYCRARAIGTTNLSLAREDFLAFSVPEPTNDQLALTELLDIVEDKIELNRRMNETLQAIAQTLFKSWFIDFDPVRAKRVGQAPGGLDSVTAALFPSRLVASPLGEMPVGWSTTTLAEVTSKIGSGATPRGGDRAYISQGTAFIRSQNVYDSEFVWQGLAFISDTDAEQLRGVTVQPDDVLLNITGASILRTCVVEQQVLPARVNQHVAIVRAKPTVPARYLHFHLLRAQTKAYLLGLDAGASRQAVTKAHIESVPIMLPTPALLQKFNETCAPMFSMMDNNRVQTRTLAILRDTLLSRLLSNELDPRSAKREVERVA